ncbi:MAG: phospholipase D family protein [Actinomycetota bacterium]|nr:phospholipase D family protein [Actinomycetota bacterium]
MALDDWFLTADERGNAATRIDSGRSGAPSADTVAWTTGNLVVAHVHGASYFPRLYEVVSQLKAGDHLFVTDWRGDPDERLAGPGTEVSYVLSEAARRGVCVKGLVWRSHLDRFQFSSEENRHLGEEVDAAGGEMLLDQRVRPGGSHHQKLVVARYAGRKPYGVAFVGGIDLCHSRHDDENHLGDPQPQRLPGPYGPTPPWHDVQLEISGPAVSDLELTFRERWEDPTPISLNPVGLALDKLRGDDRRGGPLPPVPPTPPASGPHAVQVLRTYPKRRPPYPFAPDGERSVARAYRKAMSRARRLVYLEDQYLWSTSVAKVLGEALRRSPDLHILAVVPRFPDRSGRVSTPMNLVGRDQAMAVLDALGPGRVHVFDVENLAGTPVYVHAKVCVVDDVWCSVGSDNFNLRSWSHDSELTAAVLDETRDARHPEDPAGLGDGARVFARDLRLRLWREHLGREEGHYDDLLDPSSALESFGKCADALDDWYRSGRKGPRPAGRVRRHRTIPLTPSARVWATPLYRSLVDPDGRPIRLRLRDRW